MSDLTCGKNGMPTYAAPVRIFRPGDPGFPDSVTICNAQEIPPMTATRISSKTRQCVNCKREYTPTGNRQQKCSACASKSKPPTKPGAKPEAQKPNASAVAEVISKLRAKAAPPPVAAQPTGAGGDLYQQLSARRVQMLDDIAAIDRVLAIL